jgi:hypothetical protein
MPKYKVKELSLIGNELHQAGAIVEYDGLPSENLEPTCDEGRAKYQEYLESNKKRVAAMKEQFTESAVGDPSVFMAKMVEMQSNQAEQIASAVSKAVAEAMGALLAPEKKTRKSAVESVE